MSTTFANSIDSNPIYADRAENDKDGNRIDTTYAKLADIPSGTQLVPAATSADADKVLTVNAQGAPAWAAAQSVTVDQTYDPFSANAQSGIAVASALHTKQNPLTAGDGISIDENDEISAKLGDGLEIGTSLSPVTDIARATGCSDPDIGVSVMQLLMNGELAAAIETTGLTFTVQNLTDNNNVSRGWTYWGNNSRKLYPAICRIGDYGTGPATDPSLCLVLSTTGIDVASSSGTIPAGTQFVYNLDDINTSLSTITWETISDQPDNYSLSVVWRGSNMTYSVSALGTYTKNELYDSGTLSYQTATLGAITVTNPLPASTSSDVNKVLKVNASGEPEWATGGGGSQVQSDWTEADSSDPSYIQNKPTPKTLTAGANISISEGVGTLTISAAAGLPASTSADEGKCLVVDSNGDPEWGTGGKTYTGTDGVVVDNVNDTVGLEAPVDIVAGPGITVDNPDGNTVRVSTNANSFFKELYYNATNTNDTAGKVYSLSEPITNFMYAKITVDNMEYTNAPLVYEIDVQHNTTTCQWNSPLRNGNVNNTINLPVCQLQINASGNLVLVDRGLTYNTYPSPQFTNGDSRGMRVVRVVGIFRIAGGN